MRFNFGNFFEYSTYKNGIISIKIYLYCSSLLSDRDSEDESPFTALHRHSSFGRDSDTEDSRRDAFHMHRLRYFTQFMSEIL